MASDIQFGEFSAAKLFNPLSLLSDDKIQWKGETEKKVYLVATVTIGVLSAGILHGIYAAVRLCGRGSKMEEEQTPLRATLSKDGLQVTKDLPSLFNVDRGNRTGKNIIEGKLKILTEPNATCISVIDHHIGFTGIGMVNNGESMIAKIGIEIEPGKKNALIFRVLNFQETGGGNIPLIEVNGQSLKEGEKAYFKEGINEIKFDSETILTFTLPSSEEKLT